MAGRLYSVLSVRCTWHDTLRTRLPTFQVQKVPQNSISGHENTYFPVQNNIEPVVQQSHGPKKQKATLGKKKQKAGFLDSAAVNCRPRGHGTAWAT